MNSRAELKELTLLFDVSICLNKSKNIKDVLHQILEMMAKYTGLERGTITLLNKGTSEIKIEEAYGLTAEEKARGTYKVGEGIIGKVVESGMSVYIPRISDEPQFLDKTMARNKIDKEDVSFLCVPIKHDKEVIGTLSVDRVYNNNFSTMKNWLPNAGVGIRYEVQKRMNARVDFGIGEDSNAFYISFNEAF